MNSGCLYIKRENFKFSEAYGIYYSTIPPIPYYLDEYGDVHIDVTKQIVIDGDFHRTQYDSAAQKWKELDEFLAAIPFSARFEVDNINNINAEIPGNSSYRVQITVNTMANILYNGDTNNYGMTLQIVSA